MGHWMRLLSSLLAALPLCASADRDVIYDDPKGIEVPADFGCIHHVGMEICWPCLGGNNLYFGPDPGFDAKVNAVRLYGMGGLEWGKSTEKEPGKYDWTHWDSAFAKLRRVGVKTVIYTIYNPPPFYTRHPHDYAMWKGQLPSSQAALDEWLTAITLRYPEIKIVEIANEVFAPSIKEGAWTGSEQELAKLADWVLDWRTRTQWPGKVWSPSIPGFVPNVKPFVRWLREYPRTKEFDAISAHFYYVTADHLGQRASKANAWTALAELRKAMRAAGIDKPIVDGEKGFAPGVASASAIYNYGVKVALEGLQQVCFFHWGSYGNDETNIGQPFRNPGVKRAFEDLSALAGKRITRVERGAGPDSRWIVTVQDPAQTPKR